MSLKGNAAVLTKPFNFEILEYPVPKVEFGGILIEVSASAICGSDLHAWRGERKMKGGIILGHELTGRIHTLGAGVSTDYLGKSLSIGDRVIFTYFSPCHRCYQCIRGKFTDCPSNFNLRKTIEEYPYCTGGFADYYYIRPGAFVFKVESHLPDDAITSINCALATVMSAIERSNMNTGDTVVIQGVGALGLYATLYARERGAGTIITIDGQENRLELSKKCGADHTININNIKDEFERIKIVKELSGSSNGADVVIEVAGVPQVINEGLEMLRLGGTFVEVGNIIPESNVNVDFNRILHGIKYVVPASFYEPWLLPIGVKLIERTKDKYPIANIISHNFKLNEINDAFNFSEWSRDGGTDVIRSVVMPK
tara:strand:+ start:26711 stop:27820 length:1110 start_codon:yes stop_codon:yes gene_type:complete